MNTELKKVAKDDFGKDLFKLLNNAVFGKTMENIRKHRDIKLVTTDKRRSKLVSDPNYHTINYISEDLSIIAMNKTKVKMNKPLTSKKDLIRQIMMLFTLPLPIGKNKKVIGLMKDELGGKIITEFVTLRPKTYSYLTDDCKEDKKAKGTKKMCNKKDD